ncbi:MAG: thioredoxin domain-containing protein [Alphaproteobacteria bacterium]|nr:thioredoxin domain-containing protein [Alphaproteobacteria bacterium]
MPASALETSLSPYLRLHKDNPVAWRVWGPEAMTEAEAAGKPIFLSIGYTGCHWCHVMNEESFSDPEIAATLNEHFIPVLLDKEERPDIDLFYQSAMPLMGLGGGWPLNILLTPDGAPFFVTQYVPKDERMGQPSFRSVLTDAAALWQERNGEALAQAAAVRQALETQYGSDISAGPETVQLDMAALRIAQRYDIFFGGQIGTPKMPLACQLELLWRAYLRTGLPQYSQLLFGALDNMLYGALWDHVGGGFFRYCHDERWTIPHFEKSLADNAQMLDILSGVYQINRSTLVRSRAEELVAWLLRQMKLPGGGFASHLDSRSEGQEALYYVWTEAEMDAALVGTFAARFKSIYEISHDGNFFGRNIPRRLSMASQPTSDADEALLAKQRAMLLAARDKRTPPLRDDKLLADANGLTIAALALAGAVFERADWLAEAVTTFNAVAATLGDGARLYHAALDGQHGAHGFADDYANMARAALQLYEVSGDRRFLEQAKIWVKTLDTHFWDEARGGYFYTDDTLSSPLLRPRFHTDNPASPANATMLGVLSRLILLTGEQPYTEHAPRLLRSFAGEAGRSFPGMAAYFNGAETYSVALQVVVFGSRASAQTQELIRTVWGKALPGRLLVVVEPGMSLPAGHPCADAGMQNNQPTAYLCQGATRAGPITSPVMLSQLLTLPQQKRPDA